MSHPTTLPKFLFAAVLSTALSAQTAGPVIPAAVAGAGAVFVDRPRADEPTVWLRGERYKASIDGAAATYIPYLGAKAPRNVPIRLTIDGVRCGGVAIDATAGEVSIEGERVTVERAGFAEVYDARAEGLEQSFRFDRLPARGDLEIALGVDSEAAATSDGPDVVFGSELGVVRYSGLVAIDGRGERVVLPIGVEHDRLFLRVPADFVRRAALPLVVDPVLSTVTVASPPDVRMEPDLAWNSRVQEHLVVWRVPFSANDWDVAAVRTDFWMNPIGASFWIDYTSQNWSAPRVACKQYEGMFLIVASVDLGGVSPHWIAGRRYEAYGGNRVLWSVFDIQRPGVSGHLPGDSFHPDVSGDPALLQYATWFVVVWEYRGSGNGDILSRQLRADGTFGPGSVGVINTGPYDDREPSICKSPGAGAYGIVWTQYNGFSPGGDIVAAEMDVNGQWLVQPFFLDSSANDDTRPRISTPSLCVPGRKTMLVTWQRNFDPFSGYGRLHAAAITDNPNAVLINRWDLSALLGVPNGTFASEPVVDSDGVRFAVAHTEWTGAQNLVRASTVAIDGALLRVHEARAPLTYGATSTFSPSIASNYGGGLNNTRTYAVAGASNAIALPGWIYNGHQPGAFFQVRSTGCGGLPIAYSGYPTLGDAVAFDVGGPVAPPYMGLQLGFPAPATPISVCTSCTSGLVAVVNVPPSYTWQVPYLPALVGVTLSAQGYAIGGGPCLGAIALSDTVDFTLR